MKIYQYDDIPLNYIQGNVLEIGVNEERLLASRLVDKLGEVGKITPYNYLGIDIVPKDGLFDVVQADIIDYELIDSYRTILMIEVLEHIKLCYWEKVIDKLKNALKPGGWLIISVPYKQRLSDYIYHPDLCLRVDQVHTIFGIDKKVMERFLPDAKMSILSRYWWRQDGVSFIWACGRFVARLLTGVSPIKRNLLVCWQKESKFI